MSKEQEQFEIRFFVLKVGLRRRSKFRLAGVGSRRFEQGT